MLDVQEYLKIFIGIIAILNPLGAVPLYLSLTAHHSEQDKKDVALTAAKGAAVILLVALFFGELILGFFGISIHSFRVGGGILILLMAISMLHAKTSEAKNTEAERQEASRRESVAIVPLAMPMLAGPGAISSIILYGERAEGWQHYALISAEIMAVGALVAILLRLSGKIARKLGQTGMNIITRVMGLMLAAIAIEFISLGLKGLFPVLTH